jgi:tripeptidyl-peptidase-1
MFLLKTLSAVLAVAYSVVALNIPNVKAVASRDATFQSHVFEKLSGPPKGWVRDDTTTFDKDVSTVKLVIQLVQENMDRFHELAMNVC